MLVILNRKNWISKNSKSAEVYQPPSMMPIPLQSPALVDDGTIKIHIITNVIPLWAQCSTMSNSNVYGYVH